MAPLWREHTTSWQTLISLVTKVLDHSHLLDYDPLVVDEVAIRVMGTTAREIIVKRWLHLDLPLHDWPEACLLLPRLIVNCLL